MGGEFAPRNNMAIMKTRFIPYALSRKAPKALHVALLVLAHTAVSQAALTVVTLTGDSNSTAFIGSGFTTGNNNVGVTLNDTFSYDPNTYSPTVGTQPARGDAAGGAYPGAGFHGNDGPGTAGSQFLRYTFSSLTTLDNGAQFVVDLWGRNHAPAYPRHESFTINLYNGAFGTTPVATLASGISASATTQYGRTTFTLAQGLTFDRFEIVDDTDFFSIAETRAAFNAVPEPTVTLLGGLGLLALLRRRR